ncbi:MAG: radical SAM protein [Sedimentisphaerales bacterium]|nr:radical SAM protein [Sedimentisphaerales bacterium]
MINISKLYCNLAGQSDDLRYNRPDTFGPIVVFNCTARCNLRCLHCYSSSDASCGQNELTTEQAKRFLAQLPEANVPVALFSGGEPLLREDLMELLAEAKGLGLRTVISTNGTRIDRDTAGRLAERELSYIGISLDGQEPFHDEFRQTQGSFRAALKGIENCHRAGLRTGLRFTITKSNAGQVPAVFDIAVDAGIRRICFYHLISSGRARDLDEQAPTLEQTRGTVNTIIDRTRELADKDLVEEVLTVGNHADGPFLLVRMQAEGHRAFESVRQLLRANGGNRIGEKIACVSWDGTVYADQFWRNYPLGNVMQIPFGQIWANTADPVLGKLRRKDTFADPRCLTCRWFDLCKGNYRFLGCDPGDEQWRNEPPCYLTDEEIGRT